MGQTESFVSSHGKKSLLSLSVYSTTKSSTSLSSRQALTLILLEKHKFLLPFAVLLIVVCSRLYKLRNLRWRISRVLENASKLNSCHHRFSSTAVDLRVFQLCCCKSDKDLLYYRIINHRYDSLNPFSQSSQNRKRCLFNCVSWIIFSLARLGDHRRFCLKYIRSGLFVNVLLIFDFQIFFLVPATQNTKIIERWWMQKVRS